SAFAVKSLPLKLLLGIGAPTVALAGVGVVWFSHLTRRDLALEAVQSLFALAVLLVLATGVSVHFMLTRPLPRLAIAMRRAGEGDMLVRADRDGEDEVGQLATAFNRMLEAMTSLKADEIDANTTLAAAQAELKLKAELERRVNELAVLYDVARELTGALEL